MPLNGQQVICSIIEYGILYSMNVDKTVLYNIVGDNILTLFAFNRNQRH